MTHNFGTASQRTRESIGRVSPIDTLEVLCSARYTHQFPQNFTLTEMQNSVKHQLIVSLRND